MRGSSLHASTEVRTLNPKNRTMFLTPLHSPPLQGFEGLKLYADHCRVEIDVLHRNVKPMLSQIRSWDLIQVRDLRNLKDCAQIFPTTFSERLCESLQVRGSHEECEVFD